jgi:zinc protease
MTLVFIFFRRKVRSISGNDQVETMKPIISFIVCLTLISQASVAQSIQSPRLHVLDNGMRVVTVEDHSNPLVTSTWSAHVGDSAEPLDFAGNSHYLEHLLLFRGTEKFPKNEIGEWVAGRGGYFNGHTWYDYTTFEIMSSPVDLDAALERHEQMMFHAAFSGEDFETEKKAVFEELRSGLDTPYGYLYRAAGYFMYPEETYYSRSTIGSIETVQAATVERVRRYYEDYYVPNNITLAIVGDFDTDTVLESVTARFGNYPRSELPASQYRAVSMKPGINLVTEERDVGKAYYLIAFEGPRAGSPDYLPYVLLAEYLTGGQTSMLRSRLITEQQIVDEVDAEPWPRRYPKGWQSIGGETEPGKLAEAVNAIWQLLNQVRQSGVPAEDIDFARKRLLKKHRQLLDDQYQVGSRIVESDAHFDYSLFSDYEVNLAKVTPADIQTVARKYFSPQKFFLMSLFPPGKIPEGYEDKIRTDAAAIKAGTSGVDSRALPSGVTLITEAAPGAAMESFTVAIRAGDRAGKHAGIGEAVVTMMARETKNYSRTKLQNHLDQQGFSLSAETNADGAFISLQAPAGSTEEATKLLSHILTSPGFTEQEWDDTRDEMLAALTSSLDQPRVIARDLLDKAVYAGTPYGRSIEDTQESLTSLDVSDLKSFWSSHYKAEAIAITYVGAASPEALAAGFKSLDKLRGKAPAQPDIDIAAFSTKVRRAVPMEGKTQANLYMAWSAPDLRSDEWVLWQLARKAIGGDLAGRLWKLRQIEGLAYSVWLSSSNTRDEPLTYVYMATAGEKRDAALAAIDREIRRAIQGLTAEELERVKVSYLAEQSRTNRTAARRSQRQASWWVRGHTHRRSERLQEIIGSATLETVNKVVNDVLDPDNYVLAEAGLVPE